MALAYLSLTRYSINKTHPRYFYAVDASIGQSVVNRLHRVITREFGLVFEVRDPGGLDEEWIDAKDGIEATWGELELHWGGVGPKQLSDRAKYALVCMRYEDEFYGRFPARDTRLYAIRYHLDALGIDSDAGVVAGEQIAVAIAERMERLNNHTMRFWTVRLSPLGIAGEPEDSRVAQYEAEERNRRGWPELAENQPIQSAPSAMAGDVLRCLCDELNTELVAWFSANPFSDAVQLRKSHGRLQERIAAVLAKMPSDFHAPALADLMICAIPVDFQETIERAMDEVSRIRAKAIMAGISIAPVSQPKMETMTVENPVAGAAEPAVEEEPEEESAGDAGPEPVAESVADNDEGEEDTGAEAGVNGGDAGGDIILDPTEAKILRALADARVTLKNEELSAAIEETEPGCRIAPRTIGKRLERLRKVGLAIRANGDRKGHAITPAGRAKLGDDRS